MYVPGSKNVEIKNYMGGVNITKNPADIHSDQSPSALNVFNQEIFGVGQRYGYSSVYTTSFMTSLAATAMHNIYILNQYNTSIFFYHYGTGLYKYTGAVLSNLYSGIIPTQSRGFELSGMLYIMDGSAILECSAGVTTATIPSAYQPTYLIGMSPSNGDGVSFEQLNYLTSAYWLQYNGTGSATFYLPFTTGLLSTGLVSIAGVSTLKATDWTINTTVGTITILSGFTGTTGTNNIYVKSYYTGLDATNIYNCKFGNVWGEGNVMAFIGGNSAIANRLYWCHPVQGMSYFPYSSSVDVGVTNDKLMNVKPDGNTLKIIKKNSIWQMIGEPPDYSLQMLVNGEGALSPDAIEIVDGKLTVESNRGMVQLIKGNEGYYLKVVSENINGINNIRDGITTATDANKSIAFCYDFDGDLWLVVGSYVYVYRYGQIHTIDGDEVHPWWVWQLNSTPTCFVAKDGYLYFGAENNVYKLDPAVINDYSITTSDHVAAISSYFHSKRDTIDNSPDWVKWFLYNWFDFRAREKNFVETNAVINIYVDDQEIRTSFAIEQQFWNPNSWNPNAFVIDPSSPVTSKRAPIMRKGRYIQYKISSTSASKSWYLGTTKIEYKPDRRGV